MLSASFVTIGQHFFFGGRKVNKCLYLNIKVPDRYRYENLRQIKGFQGYLNSKFKVYSKLIRRENKIIYDTVKVNCKYMPVGSDIKYVKGALLFLKLLQNFF